MYTIKPNPWSPPAFATNTHENTIPKAATIIHNYQPHNRVHNVCERERGKILYETRINLLSYSVNQIWFSTVVCGFYGKLQG